MTIEELTAQAERILDEVERAVVGKREALELVLLGILADGHVLIEDFPGLAKTLIARSFARTMGLEFARIQFTPDLMPADITGSSIYSPQQADFEFRPGPIFANLVLADEINRAPPKTQAALLEAMQERQVTIDGRTLLLETPFLVLATQNPIEHEGTYPLPEAQLDRFVLRMGLATRRATTSGRCSAPARADRGGGRARADRRPADAPRHAACDRAGARRGERGLLHRRPRDCDAERVRGASRGQPQGLARSAQASRCRAALSGRDYVTPDDVKEIAVPALAHRLTLKPELWVERLRSDDIVRELLDEVPTPPVQQPAPQ